MFGSIQMLRGLAASMVVIFHAILRFGAGPTIEPKIDFLNGGVDIFFVISGFVMVIATAQRDHSAHDFPTARILRIVPLYWLATAALLALMAFGWAERATPRVDEVVKSLLFLFYTDSATKAALPVLGVGWTLNYEMYFYVVFAATLWLALPRQIAVLIVFFLVVAASRVMIHSDDPVVARLVSPLPLEFSFGMILGWQRRRLAKIPVAWGYALSLLGAGLLIAPVPGPRTLAAGIPAAIILAGAVVAEPSTPARGLKPLWLIGDASYALYLTHDILMHLSITATFARAFGTLAVPAVFLLCCAVAVLVHIALERPVIRLSKRFRRNRPAPPERQPAPAEEPT